MAARRRTKRPQSAGQPASAVGQAAWRLRAEDRWPWLLGAVALLALILRLAHLASLADSPYASVLVGDGRVYDAWAADIAAGHWLGTDAFYQAPLYPYLMACVFVVAGHSLTTLRVIQAVLGALSCVLLGVAGCRFFSPRAGVLAALLLAVYPPAIFFDGLVQKSSLDLFLVTALLACLGVWLDAPRHRWLIGAGAALGAFALNRENARVLYPVIAGWLLMWDQAVPIRARAVRAAVFTAAVAAMLIPVGLRNYVVGGEFLVSTSQAGPNFYIGNRSGASGLYEPLVPDRGDAAYEREDATRLAVEASGRNLSPSEVSDYWMTRALEDIRRAPWAWVCGLGRKAVLVLNAREAIDTESVEAYAEYSLVLRVLGWLSFGVVLPLAMLGAWLTRAAWKRHAVLLVMAAALAGSVVIFYVFARYRFPLVPLLVLYAGAALAQLPERASVPRREWMAGLALAVLAAVAAYLPLTMSADGTDWNAGKELMKLGRSADAVPLFEKATRRLPGFAPAWYDLGVARMQAGAREPAAEAFTAALRLRPDYAQAHSNLGVVLEGLGRSDEARSHFEAVVRLTPGDGAAHKNLAQSLMKEGRADQAIAEFNAALRLAPSDASIHNNLAGLLQQGGRADEALRHLREAVRLQPSQVDARLNLGILLADQGKVDEGIAQVGEAVRLAPDSIEAVYTLGMLDARSRRWTGAIAAFTQALTLARAGGRTDLIPTIETALRTCEQERQSGRR